MRILTAIVTTVALCACAPKHEYPDGSGLQGQLEREIIALQQTIRRLEVENDCNGRQPDALYSELTQILPARAVTLTADGNTTVILLPDSLIFGSDLLSIRDEARMTLDLLATALNRYPKHTVTVEGHTSDTFPNTALASRFRTLWDLSYARAASIKDVLVTQFHVDERRFSVVSRADTVPVANNDTDAGQAQNRRVVIYIRPPA